MIATWRGDSGEATRERRVRGNAPIAHSSDIPAAGKNPYRYELARWRIIERDIRPEPVAISEMPPRIGMRRADAA